VKIDINKIPLGGVILEEEVNAKDLDLENDTVKFSRFLKIRAEVYRITNAVTVELQLRSLMRLSCSRCLSEFEIPFKKDLRLNYEAEKTNPIIDLNQDIKEEIVLDHPLKPLCKPDCRGLCPKCGENLNEETCGCLKFNV